MSFTIISDDAMQAHRAETAQANRHSAVLPRSVEQWRVNTTGTQQRLIKKSYVRSTPRREDDTSSNPVCDHVAVFENVDGSRSEFNGTLWTHIPAPKTQA